MTKQKLLKKLHTLVWKNDDNLDQDDLFALQTLIDTEVVTEANKGKLNIVQLDNGYIKDIKIV